MPGQPTPDPAAQWVRGQITRIDDVFKAGRDDIEALRRMPLDTAKEREFAMRLLGAITYGMWEQMLEFYEDMRSQAVVWPDESRRN